MTLEELKTIFNTLGYLGLGAIIGGVIIYFFLKNYIPNYLSEKAKNLAQKEDITEITVSVEKVKSDYQAILEEVKTNNQLRVSAIDREQSLKKEVYLEAIESITKTQSMIASFCNLDISEQQISSYFSAESGTISKIQLVGSEDTVQAVTKFMGAVGEATLSLMLGRINLTSRKNEIKIIENYRNNSQIELERYLSIMKDLNLRGITDDLTWLRIKGQYETEQKNLDNYNSQLDELWKTQNKEHIAYVKICMEWSFDLSTLLPTALLSARKELDLEIDEKKYFAMVEQNTASGKKIFEHFLSHLQKEL